MLGDDELADFALAADADTSVGDDAVSLWDLAPPDRFELLPAWYMPPPARRQLLRGWRRAVVVVVIVAFVIIEAAGLCTTYGQVVVPGS